MSKKMYVSPLIYPDYQSRRTIAQKIKFQGSRDWRWKNIGFEFAWETTTYLVNMRSVYRIISSHTSSISAF